MPTKPITTHKLDKTGKLVAKPPRVSVSKKIAMRKSKKVTVVRRQK
jgi:hypothetical protein